MFSKIFVLLTVKISRSYRRDIKLEKDIERYIERIESTATFQLQKFENVLTKVRKKIES